ncbi:Serine/Threonine kinase domain protein (macronuclear) [Tetrahymena thermophila SB210]|uniref:Aurora kinase n=1 Tax=Tetrahymena thermophila (strain SB210) TaxID=312017 RepID=Q248K2_TETTS|nr:Serine/Threonine kinase domain protein [Tetrahymena thermophila SB210]EAS04203.2 Serine/Threonine kinase domain protein [Tetrahymena thermophila SB210]|eukprot:XP_001024448.2 Serine/Threonine kinase domain protein [Tetrahymena thermophila SB210]
MNNQFGNDNLFLQDGAENLMNIDIKNRGIFTNTQPFQFIIDQQGNKINLGEGSFGFVLLIKNIQTNQLYALKLIPMSSIETLTHKRIIEREVKVHPELSHPYIIKMHDAFINKDAIYIILDYAVNKNVSETFLQDFKYNEARAFKYFYQTCLAIDYLHKKGIMHRDIKPENLLLDENDNIKLCDFGWCAEITKNRRNTLCGTFEYMAPETITERDYDYKIDIWQLGILLYELLHGRTPFKPNFELGEDERMEYYKNTINQGHIVFDSHISPSAIDLISQILIYVPEKRISIQGILAHVWIFQMKAKTGYKDPTQILQQFQDNEQNILSQKLNQEQELLQTQKLLKGAMSSQVKQQQYSKTFNNLQSAPVNKTSLNIFFNSNINVNQNEKTSQNIQYNNQNTIQLPDWNSNLNVINPVMDKKNNFRKSSLEDIKESQLPFQVGVSQIKKPQQEKIIIQSVSIYQRELARMASDNEKETLTIDLQDLPLKNDQKATDLQGQYYLPSYCQRKDYQSYISARSTTIIRSNMLKQSSQFDISTTSNNRRTIFGEFNKEKKQRNILELEKLIDQLDIDKNKKYQTANEYKEKFIFNDSLSEISQGSNIKYSKIFQNRKS